MQTHEQYLKAVALVAVSLAQGLTPDQRRDLLAIKLVYGSGPAGTRGVTFFKHWTKGKGQEPMPFVEICAFGQENHCQLAGTTIHELAHVLAGCEAGHGTKWKAACETLGLRRAMAAGHEYHWANFCPVVREAICALRKPDDGQPVRDLGLGANALGVKLKPCPVGFGSRGGKSRGPGSGSRLRLWLCDCEPPIRVRVSSDNFLAHCDVCSGSFRKG